MSTLGRVRKLKNWLSQKLSSQPMHLKYSMGSSNLTMTAGFEPAGAAYLTATFPLPISVPGVVLHGLLLNFLYSESCSTQP